MQSILFDKVTLGATPCDESCAQIGDEGYELLARRECRAYKNQLKRIMDIWKAKHPKTAPSVKDCYLEVVPHAHDFGTYVEVSVVFNPECESAVNLASYLESHLPGEWDADARKELNLATA